MLTAASSAPAPNAIRCALGLADVSFSTVSAEAAYPSGSGSQNATARKKALARKRRSARDAARRARRADSPSAIPPSYGVRGARGKQPPGLVRKADGHEHVNGEQPEKFPSRGHPEKRARSGTPQVKHRPERWDSHRQRVVAWSRGVPTSEPWVSSARPLTATCENAPRRFRAKSPCEALAERAALRSNGER
jgi:hypothetical protein